MIDVRMYCTVMCPYCTRAEHLLKSKGVKIDKIFIASMEEFIGAVSGFVFDGGDEGLALTGWPLCLGACR